MKVFNIRKVENVDEELENNAVSSLDEELDEEETEPNVENCDQISAQKPPESRATKTLSFQPKNYHEERTSFQLYHEERLKEIKELNNELGKIDLE